MINKSKMQDQFKDLLDRYKAGTATEEEIAFLESWYAEYQPEGPEYNPADQVMDTKRIWDELQSAQPEAKRINLWPRIVAAASVVVALSVGAYFLLHRGTTYLTANNIFAKAILALPGGRHIVLADVANGKLTAGIIKANGSELVYHEISSSQTSTIAYDTLTVPRGGHFQLTMADGSKIWLNAATVIRYPETCLGDERKIELVKGEAYFEVMHNSSKPFRVISRNQVTEDIGTRFNVNAYEDEPMVQTTLLEGSVSVADDKGKVILKPGQKSVVKAPGSDIIIQNANLDEAVAWKNNRFVFNNDDITSVMRQVSRWYDVEVTYDGNMTGKEFTGSIARSEKVDEVLRKLEETGNIHYRMEGKRIIITP
ncbi:MAG TPA: FecR domain-containing protein [Mucilaginibacter sp.]|nr:FecR domain-containing protein [Mucilaginibacter sp.]